MVGTIRVCISNEIVSPAFVCLLSFSPSKPMKCHPIFIRVILLGIDPKPFLSIYSTFLAKTRILFSFRLVFFFLPESKYVCIYHSLLLFLEDRYARDCKGKAQVPNGKER